MRKKLLCAVLCMAMVSILAAGCSKESTDKSTDTQDSEAAGEEMAASGDSHKCGFIVGSFEYPFYQKIAEAIESRSQEVGIEAIVTDAELDPNVASNKVQDLTAQGCEAIALSCNDPEGVKSAIDNADSKGVAMFTFDYTADSDAVKCFVGTDNDKGGQLGGQELLKYSEDGDTVGIIGQPEDSAALDRENGALAVLEGQNRAVLDNNDSEGDSVKAQEIMKSMLAEAPDIAAVFCVSDSAAVGALAAVKEAGADCRIIGYGGNPEALESIADAEGNGKWWVSEVTPDPEAIGKTLVEQIWKCLNEGEADAKEIPVEPYIVDADNVSEEM